MSRIDPGFGLVLLDPRLDDNTLAPTGVATRSSAYTQDGPVPGSPVPADSASTWRPQVTGAQSVGLSLATVRGGYAGREGAEVLYRRATDSANADYRSWSDPNLVTGFTSGESSGATGTSGVTWSTVAACGIPSSGLIVLALVDDTTGAGRVWRYNTRTGKWTDGHIFSSPNPGLEGPIGLVYDEDHDRVILYSGASNSAGLRQSAFYSTDAGLTFAGYSRRTLGGSTVSGADVGAIRPAARPGGLDWIMFLIDETNGTGEGSQWASSDSGVTYELVESVTAGLQGMYPVWTGSAFVVAYVDTADNSAKVRILPSARARFNDAAEVVVDGSRDVGLVVPVVDADGVIYLYATLKTGGFNYPDLAVYRSTDGGQSWTRYITDAIGSEIANGTRYEWGAGVALAGCVYLVGMGTTDATPGILRLGGYGQVAHGGGAKGEVLDHTRRVGWADSYDGTSIEGRCYLPAANPTNVSFAVASVGATISVTGEGLSISAAAAGAPGEWSYTCTGAAKLSVMFECEVRNQGGDTRAVVIAGGPGPHATLRLSDAATFEYDVVVHFASDGIALEDGNSGATIESIALTMNGTVGGIDTWTRVRVHLVKGRVDWWYQQTEGDLDGVWIKGTGGTVSNGGAFPTQSRIVWGMATTITAATTVRYRWLGVSFGGEWQHSVEGLTEWEKAYSDGVRGHTWGRPLPGRESPYPVPDLTSTTEDLGYLSASGGPTYSGELVELPVGYTYAVGAVVPTRSPSPRDVWRATDTTEVKLVYDLGAAQWYGDALALLVIRGRPYEWILETDDGGAGWTTIGTLDLTVGSGLTYTLTGEVLVANGGATVARYVAEGELVGGYVTAGTVAAPIVANGAGFWGGTSRQQLRITIDDPGSFPAGRSDLRIVSPQGLLVVYPTAVVIRRYVRIRAAAAAIVPGSRYSAGIAAVGRVLAIGADPAWNWRRTTSAQVRRSRSSDGVTYARELGPPVRSIAYSWPEYQDLRKLREPADYVGVSGGLAVGTGEDSAGLPNVIEVIGSGAYPVVVVPRLPTSTGSLVGRDELIYGRVTSDALGVTGKLGTEGIDEVVTVSELVVDELR